MAIEPLKILSEATRKIPALKYAWAVAGIVAASSIAFNLSQDQPLRAILGFVFVLVGMVLVAALTRAVPDGATMRGPAFLVVWAVTILFVLTLLVAFTAFLFGWPRTLALRLGAIPADARNEASQPQVAPTAPAQPSPPPPTAPSGATSPAPPPPSPVSVSQPFRISDSSNDCAANFTREIELCLPQSAQVTGWSDPRIGSVNCGSTIQNLRRSPTHPNCITVDVAIRGCGYDDFGFVRNCRGRGWVEGVIEVRGESPR